MHVSYAQNAFDSEHVVCYSLITQERDTDMFNAANDNLALADMLTRAEFLQKYRRLTLDTAKEYAYSIRDHHRYDDQMSQLIESGEIDDDHLDRVAFAMFINEYIDHHNDIE